MTWCMCRVKHLIVISVDHKHLLSHPCETDMLCLAFDCMEPVKLRKCSEIHYCRAHWHNKIVYSQPGTLYKYLPFFLSPSTFDLLITCTPDHTHTHTHTHTLGTTSRDEVIAPTQITVPDNTQHSQGREVHARTDIRNRSFSNRAAADPCLRPRCHRNRSL